MFIFMLSAVQEMISIMQDYGEVVCCVGSSFNSANPATFIQADMRWVQVSETISNYAVILVKRKRRVLLKIC